MNDEFDFLDEADKEFGENKPYFDLERYLAEHPELLAEGLADFSADPSDLILDVPFVPSDARLIELMLDMANVTSKDILYDLGCGDGRIVVAAAKQRGTHGVGVDLDPVRVGDAMELAANMGVEYLVDFIEADLRAVDVSKASVVMLYLLDHVNVEIKPKLLKELKPGSRIVSNTFDMGDWQPDKQLCYKHHNVFMWVVPEN